jgi:hypothetical protein
MRGVVGRAGTTSVLDLDRWAPSDAATRFVEHFWSVQWDLRGRDPFDSTVITFPSMHITREWGEDAPRHGFGLPNTLQHGVVERVFHTAIRERGAVVGARFRPGGFAARFNCDAAALTGRVDRIRDDGRPHRVEQVMEHSPWGARTTQRVFRRYVGVPALHQRLPFHARQHAG